MAVERVEQAASAVGGQVEASVRPDAVGEEGKAALRGKARVELPQAARGGVARVHERLLAQLERALVDRLEVAARHQHLAAHLEELRRLARVQAQRDRAHGAQVRRHVPPPWCRRRAWRPARGRRSHRRA
jgi:hypothetical protein